jgi:cytoskeletal protein RodZ
LRHAREAKGLSVDELKRVTKISATNLIALEAGDVSRLPATVYIRGFLEAYTKEIGLDPKVVVPQYLSAIGRDAPQPDQSNKGAFTPPAKMLDATMRWKSYSTALLTETQRRRFSRITSAAATVGLVLYVVWFTRHPDAGQEPGMSAQPLTYDVAGTAEVAVSNRREVVAGARADSVSVTINGPLAVELLPQGPCWLVATVDGRRVLFQLLQPGERHTLAVGEEAVLRIGDPGALSISINGQTGRALGRPGEPVNVKITKDNFKDFLSS